MDSLGGPKTLIWSYVIKGNLGNHFLEWVDGWEKGGRVWKQEIALLATIH